MEEPRPVLETPPDAPQPHAMSLAARLLNVFAIPGEVFAGVKVSRLCIGNWLVPALLSVVVGVFTAVVIVSLPAKQKQMRDWTEHISKAFDQQVKAGKAKQEDADRAMAVVRAVTAPATLKLLRSLAAALAGVARVFWWGFILWGLGRLCLKVRLGYLKTLEVAGLGLMISVLGSVVTLLLVVNLPRLFATTSLTLAASDFDANKQGYLLAGALGVFAFWLVGVLSVGLAKLAGVPFLRAVWFVFAFWLVQESFFTLVGGVLGQFAL